MSHSIGFLVNIGSNKTVYSTWSYHISVIHSPLISLIAERSWGTGHKTITTSSLSYALLTMYTIIGIIRCLGPSQVVMMWNEAPPGVSFHTMT